MKSSFKKINRKRKDKNPDNPVHTQDVNSHSELGKVNDLHTEEEHKDFETLFLKPAKIIDRRQIYISGEFYDKIFSYLKIISDEKISLVGYVHNVLANHFQENREKINELYQSKINRCNPL